DEIFARARRIRTGAHARRYDSKCLSVSGLFDRVPDRLNYLGRMREAHKRNIMFGASKLRRDVLPLAEGDTLSELGTLLNAPIRSYRIDQARGAEAAMVYNFEVAADREIDKNFVIFTSHYTPVLVSNSHAAVVARGMGTPC